MYKAGDWILYLLMKDVTFVGVSFQETKCSWEWVRMSNLKYKPTRSLLWYSVAQVRTCRRKWSVGQYFQTNPGGVAAERQSSVPGGCRTSPAACSCCRCIPASGCQGSPGLERGTALKTWPHFPGSCTVVSHTETFRSTVRPQIFLMWAYMNTWYLEGVFFPVLAALASQSGSL